VPSAQPTATANGRPRATKPKKRGLGDSRTYGTPVAGGKRLRPPICRSLPARDPA
jgi:hypothetical protein